ncbi:MAG: tripartite tricarboxylate transporter substrate binding protein [Lachnospiraceae bacterium]|nr:tripartite tricarboxylate transporter substrate binding protein [Lachnospiraceae bacterium]
MLKKKWMILVAGMMLLGTGCGAKKEMMEQSEAAQKQEAAPAGENRRAGEAAKETDEPEQTGTSQEDLVYPQKDVSFIIPFSAGGGTDSLMRMVGSEMEKVTGQAFIINNIPGNGGAVGMTELTKAAPDGYTIAGSSVYDVLGSSFLGGDTVVYTEKDFKFICGVNVEAEVFIANPSTGFETIEDMITFAKEHPGELTVSTSGVTHNLLLGILEDRLGVKVANIAYSGGGDNFNALMGGHVDVALIGKKFASQVEGTDFKVLCAMAPEELSSLPGVPAFCKIYPEVVLPPSCRVIVAPGDTPDEVVKKLEAIVKEATDTEAFRQKMAEAGELYQFTEGSQVEAALEETAKVLKEAIEKNPAVFGLE